MSKEAIAGQECPQNQQAQELLPQGEEEKLSSEQLEDLTLRMAGIVRESFVDGPGIRFVAFCQGCPHGCPGCHNPETHDFTKGKEVSLEKILQAVDANPLLDGITFSGGEPFCQPKPLARLGQAVHQRGLNVVAFTGYTYEELLEKTHQDPAIGQLLDQVDFLIDGRFRLDQRDLSLRFRGSRNQRILDMKATREAGQPVLADQYM